MYIPQHYNLTDRDAIFSLMRQHSFATIVNVVDGVPFATHMPVMVRPDVGVMRTHIARNNPQWQAFTQDSEVLVIFQGDHSYVSPRWYEKHPSVPTWNYMTVHAYATPRIIESEPEVRELLLELVQHFEGTGQNAWDMNTLSEPYMQGMMRGLVAFELTITRLEGKLKLSQNRSSEDRAGVIQALEHSQLETERATAAAMRKANP